MSESPPDLLAFYAGTGRDASGRTIDEIWNWNHKRLEMAHDFIQWLFPLPEPSRFNPDAPLLTKRDISIFRATPDLLARARRSLDLMLDFYGFIRREGAIERTPNFADVAHWLQPLNHNYLRLTRIMLFLRHIGLVSEASQLLACLEDVAHNEGRDAVSPRTLAFWRAAASAQL